VILVVDHYDSFVYNLVQLVEASGFPAEVVRSDAEPAQAMVARRPDAVILSPGPGRPERAGRMVELVRWLDEATPVLGVCLGHQAIGVAFGARVGRAPAPVHGKATAVRHDGAGILEGLPNPFQAGRYHSLAVQRDGLPADLVVTAQTEDGVVMGIRHRRLPRFGVQFHPESILTPEGPGIVERFLSYGTAGSTSSVSERRAESSE
jgi:anthranilate synthase/aminodeoxychorismate synthase-like glutamine amidotransferase